MKHNFLVNFSFALLLLASTISKAQRIDPKTLKPLSEFKQFPAGSHYQDPKISPDKRANEVISYLTFDEKLELTGGYLKFCYPAVPRLGLRAVTMADASQGIRLTSIESKSQSVSFPGMQALSATWNIGIAKNFGQSISEECKIHGVDILLGPGINIQRLSVGGRNYEYMGEDPMLTSKIAVNYIQGLQSLDVIATAKHFIANDQEFARHIASSDLSERTLREIYLLPWEAAIKEANVQAIMTGNNLTNGIPNSMHKPLLNDLLRKEFGFTGVAMTDWQNSNYHINSQNLVAPSGLSLLMADNETFAKYIKDFIAKNPSKKASIEAELNHMIYPNIYTFFKNGIYDRYPQDLKYKDKTIAHQGLALQCAEEAICLLKNNDNILPIAKTKKILLTGEDEIHSGSGSGFVEGFNHVDFQKGLKSIYGDNLTCKVEATDEEVKNADIVLYRLNKESGEGFDIPFDEPKKAIKDIKRLSELNPNIVVLISSANGLPMPWLKNVKGILWTFMLGQERGNALASVVSGKVNPSGRLPFTLENDFKDSPDPDFNFLGGKPFWHGNNNFYKAYWKGEEPDSKKEIAKYVKPQELVHIPYEEGVFVGYRWYQKYKKPVLFPFGYGLSYTTFQYTNLKLSSENVKKDEALNVTVDIQNTGKVNGFEVVQLYLSDLESSVERPLKELKNFQKVYLKSGEKKTLTFTVNTKDLSFWDEQKHQWKAEAGKFDVLMSDSSEGYRLKKTFELK
ncbi:beta-glucosidase [Pedobacter psychrophilus]|nr:glycoside hydrolase family 3 N-terminal domain-containing protein [Pedobacter psychrophilus]